VPLEDAEIPNIRFIGNVNFFFCALRNTMTLSSRSLIGDSVYTLQPQRKILLDFYAFILLQSINNNIFHATF